MAACREREGIGEWALQRGLVAAGQDVAAHVQEVDRLGLQVANQLFQLACHALCTVVRVQQGEGVRELCGKPGERRSRRRDRASVRRH